MVDPTNYLQSIVFEFKRYKTLDDKTFEQLSEKDLQWSYGKTDNSIALIVKHMAGNMLSRWTNFLTEDGEKIWRNRDDEFENAPATREEMIQIWEKGWNCLFKALDQINVTNFNSKVHIRNEAHTLPEAINRQLAHYASHVGQIVLLGKMIKGAKWVSLSIPKGGSEEFNREKFGSKSRE